MADEKKLTILQINDTHGYLEEHWEHFFDGDHAKYIRAGGYPRIAAYIKSVREERDNQVLALDGGDTFHGTYPVIQTKGEILIPFLNDLKLDAMTAHWDFAYGPERFNQLLASLNYPMLAINVYHRDTQKLAYKPYLIKEINGIKIGVIGIAATIVDKVMPPSFSQGLYFTLGNEELPHVIAQVKEQGADFILVLSHLGYPQDLKIAQEVDGIDVLLSAHTHNRVYDPALVNGAIVIQSGCHGSFVGRLDLSIHDKKITGFNHQLTVLDESFKEDAAMKQRIKQAMLPYQEMLDTPVGTTGTDLNRNTVLESTMDNLLLQSLIHSTKADIAFSNGWRYGAPIPKGPLTENDLWNIIPVNPPVSTVQLRGEEVWDMLEENLERTFAANPYEQMGGYVKRVMGLNLYFKFENPFGQRIQELFIGDEPLMKDKVYQAVFVTSQGVPQKYGKNREKLNIKAIDALREYLKENPDARADLRGSVTAV
ncbi:MAG: bifunctional metallophosphatase/5'-nucleotidase [Clostridiales bacterium]|nr:bifunctional metallophosphatase/5'-nucleotidase [Clostridiales bacterium]